MQSTAEELSPVADCADDEDGINWPSQRSLYRRDGCRAWFVCLSAVLSNILLFGCTQTFGVIFPVLLDEFNETKAKTAWVGSLSMALPMTLSPIAAKLLNRFGPRPVSIVGGMVSALGLLMTSFTTSIDLMYGTYSLILGFGISLAYTSNFDIVPRYFKKKLCLALGVMHAGAGASFFVSPILEFLITQVGWRKTFRVLSVMVLTVCLCGLSFSLQVERDPTPQTYRETMVQLRERSKTPTQSLRRNSRLIICCVFSFVFQLGNTIPVVHLGRHAQHSGLNFGQIAFLYVGFGVATMIGRLLSGRTSDIKFVNPSYLLCCTTIIAGVSTILCPFAKDFISFLSYTCCNGLCDGIYVTIMNVLILRNSPVKKNIKWISVLLFSSSLGFAFGPPLGGFIADHVGSYIPVFYTSGSIVLLSAVLMIRFSCMKPQKGLMKNIEREMVLLYEDDMVVTEKLTVL